MNRQNIRRTIFFALLFLPSTSPARAQTTVFSTDFEAGLPPEFSAPGAAIQGVEGYAGLGPLGRQFAGGFLRYAEVPLSDTRLSLTGLPAHDHLNLGFLLAVIDSWDGTELLQVLVDGNVVFSHWFQLAVGDASSYVPAPGALLSSGVNLGFTNGSWYQRDRAYDLAVEPAFQSIPHTAATADIVWRLSAVSGSAAEQWQGGADESWAIDHVTVSLGGVVAVDDGVPVAFGIEPLHPNPVREQDLVVRFSLPVESRAHVELVDVAGRRVAEHEVAGAGRHGLTLARRGDLRSGVYFVRLTQGRNVHVRRAVVLDARSRP
jgi:hypothetical protein